MEKVNLKEIYIFLGGTCNGSIWRDGLIPLLQKEEIKYFNPVVSNWTPDCQAEEYKQKKICNTHLYIISKEMTGTFSIAEAGDSVWNKEKICIFQVLPNGFTESKLKSFRAVADLIEKRGGFASINSNINYCIDVLEGGK